MVRGTRLLIGPEAELFFDITTELRSSLRAQGFQEVLLPSLWEQETFSKKAGPEILNQMYTFKDKAERQVCLHP